MLDGITKPVSSLEYKYVRHPWDSISCQSASPQLSTSWGVTLNKGPSWFLSVVIILTTLKKDMIFPSPWERGRPIYFGLSGRPTHMPAEGQVPLGLSHVYRRLFLRSILPPTPRIPQKKSTATLDAPINAPHAYELVLYFGNTKHPTVPISLEVKSPLPMHHIPGSTPKGDLLR